MATRTLASAFVLLSGFSLDGCEARLGEPAAKAQESLPESWSKTLNETLSARALSGGAPQELDMHNYSYYGSTTVYGNTPMTACGSLNTTELVQGTEYFAVASAQAMQSVYEPDFGGCSWQCFDKQGQSVEQCEYEHPEGTLLNSKPIDGCWCQQVGACWCGKAGPQTGSASGTAPMGCFQCGRGHFLKRNPYDLNMVDGNMLVGSEIKVVVADACPYGPNAKWCPGKVGEGNALGVRNHLDFATAPTFPNNDFKNNFFVFTPEPAPGVVAEAPDHRFSSRQPCSAELQQRMLDAAQKCPANTWPYGGLN